jgi:hypothetical protein
VREGAQEILEVAVAGVAPVELHAASLEEAARAQRLRVSRRGEKHVQRREPGIAREAHHGVRELHARLLGRGEQPRARRGSERHCAKELWIVGDAMALVGFGPGPVEYVFAERVRFGVERHRAFEARALPQREVLRLPARTRGGATGGVKRVEERVGYRRIAARQPVPARGVYARKSIEDAEGGVQGGAFIINA